MSSRPLHGKVILVVGGTTGMGLSAARAILAAGGSVVALGLTPESAQTARVALGTGALVIAADATKPKTTPQAVAAALDAFGRLDGLFHVAGGSGRSRGDGPLHTVTEQGWQFTLDLNLKSLFYSNRAAVRQFLAQGGGSVLNMGSVLAFAPSPLHFATHAYAASKAAIIGLTKACAAYYAPHNIRFNVLAPALIQTPMSERVATSPALLQFIASKQPLDGGRLGQTSDVDDAAVYFLSDQSRFVTGQVLAIDGGWCVTEGQLAPQATSTPKLARRRGAAKKRSPHPRG